MYEYTSPQCLLRARVNRREKKCYKCYRRSYHIVMQKVTGAYLLFFCATEVLPKMLQGKKDFRFYPISFRVQNET